MKKLAILASALFVFLNGCAVIMAASGNPNPDKSVIKVGSSKSEIGFHLGKPKKTETLDSGYTIALYKYKVGDESSGGRAVAHGVMDILTLFGWELIGTPIEIFQGETEAVEVKFGPDNRAVSFQRR
jgi:hypothetical protein